MHRKWPDVRKYLVYFQNFTNTHEKLEVIRERYEQAINEPGVVGLNIGTRPDCLPDETIAYLADLSERMHVTVELGLQTTYEETSDLINRAHSYEHSIEEMPVGYADTLMAVSPMWALPVVLILGIVLSAVMATITAKLFKL